MTDQPEPTIHRRRNRYSGTHPKSYRDKYKEHNIDAHPELETHLRAKGKTPASTHVPIMTNEVIKYLSPKPSEIVADCTLGYGGHATEFIKHISPDGKLIAFDVDGNQLSQTKDRLASQKINMSFYHSNFAGIANVLKKENIAGYDIIFADIGLSSMQIDNPARGMSYKHDGPIDMRMDDRIKQTAADLLNTISQQKLSNALWELANEMHHAEIAEMIIARRKLTPIKQTHELVDIIFQAKGINRKDWQQENKNSKSAPTNPAAKTFQALRIMVNDELGSLKELLRVAPYCLNPGGRIGIISFHSGEDRMVKKAFQKGFDSGIYQSISENVIRPTPGEIASNTRSSSAKFRFAIGRKTP